MTGGGFVFLLIESEGTEYSSVTSATSMKNSPFVKKRYLTRDMRATLGDCRSILSLWIVEMDTFQPDLKKTSWYLC